VAISTRSYRVQHLPHHLYLGDSERDSDQRTWYNIRGWNFVRRTLLTLLGWEAVVTFRSYARASARSSGERGSESGDLFWRLTCTAFANGLLLAYCWMLGDALLYVWLWFVPMFTLTMYLLILRVIVEHQPVAYARSGVDCSGETFAQPLVRTVRPGLAGRFLLGPMNFYYHHEHHLAPSVPYPNLPRLHQLLMERGYYQRFPDALGGSYLGVLRQLVFPGGATVPTHA
jgi:fatty acid desaturase